MVPSGIVSEVTRIACDPEQGVEAWKVFGRELLSSHRYQHNMNNSVSVLGSACTKVVAFVGLLMCLMGCCCVLVYGHAAACWGMYYVVCLIYVFW